MRTDLHNWVGVAVFALALASITAAHSAETADGGLDGRLAVTPTRAAAIQQASAYLAKGRISLAQGKAGAAAADLEKAVRLQPTNVYSVLWLHFARNKEGAPDSGELQFNAARVNRAAWPGPLLDYLTGKIDASAVLAKAGEGEDKARANRLCEADLFVGQEQLTKGRRSEGLERLQAAADSCEGLPREALLARANLPGAPPPKPVLTPVSNPAPRARPLADPTVRPASIRPESLRPESISPPVQALVQRDPLLRGSLR